MALLMARGYEHLLISRDLLQHMQDAIARAGSPAQLCIMRHLGTDNEFTFRVMYGDVFLDLPVTVPLLDSAYKVEQVVNWDELARSLITMAKVVVPPEAYAEQPTSTMWGCGGGLGRSSLVSPMILAPYE